MLPLTICPGGGDLERDQGQNYGLPTAGALELWKFCGEALKASGAKFD